MEKMYVVSFYAGRCRIVEYASEDGKTFRAPTKAWALVVEPVRTVENGAVYSARDGAAHGRLNHWLTAQGVYEYWTANQEVAAAVAETVGIAHDFVPATSYKSFRT
ncbi:hypothetical protein HZC53_04870 [Candidatus Uhrbacteria bacterium]|nr:hypothetical protein [Candidatus Uhrbacteria bacterium]